MLFGEESDGEESQETVGKPCPDWQLLLLGGEPQETTEIEEIIRVYEVAAPIHVDP